MGSTCAGNTGEYLKYNNPHKTSLYLACNLPVIIWSQAALAGFVKENGLGLVVDALDQIADAASCLTEAQYAAMAKNARAMGEKIRGGGFFRAAAEKAIRDLAVME